MDSGLIFSLGVAFGLLGGVGFILLLIGTDDYATAYFSAYWSRLGGRLARDSAQDEAVNLKENVSQESNPDSGERPGASGSAPGILCLLLVALLSGCATATVKTAPAVSVPVAQLPVCGFEEPYLPDPCRKEVTPGEWLAISNPAPEPTKKHGWVWWLLIGLVTL